jgi:hypothetical protein
MDRNRRRPSAIGTAERPEISRVPTLKPAVGEAKQTGAKAAKSVAARQPAASKAPAPLTDAEVLKVLEQRRAEGSAKDKAPTDIAVLPPEDTNTRLVLRDAVARNSPVFFAVQLQWSVQPIDMKSVPPHPIFRAYKLYAAEGCRKGRTWFFLRLGFFRDAISAKQVAQYLRQSFASAAVVPVSPQEQQQVKQMGRSDAGTIARRLSARDDSR